MQTVPIQPVANQYFQAQLAGQAVGFHVYQTAYCLMMDLYVGNSLIVAGVICLNLTRIVRDLYLGFVGDVCFLDTMPDPLNGPSDPIYTGLGSRFVLVYLATTDLPSGEG